MSEVLEIDEKTIEEMEAYEQMSSEAEKAYAAGEELNASYSITLYKTELESMFAQLKREGKRNHFILNGIEYELLHKDMSNLYCLFFLKDGNTYLRIENTLVLSVVRYSPDDVNKQKPKKDIEYNCIVYRITEADYNFFEFTKACRQHGVSVLDVQHEVTEAFQNNKLTLDEAKKKYLKRSKDIRFFVNEIEMRKINNNYKLHGLVNNNNSMADAYNNFLRETLISPPLFHDPAYLLRAYNLTVANAVVELNMSIKTLKAMNANAAVAELQKLTNYIAGTGETILNIAKMATAVEMANSPEPLPDEPLDDDII